MYDNLRNFCIVAHVDHGKTTLSDSLIASNGIISQKLSGKMRYMDSRDDEQQRGITMKSSSIQLKFTLMKKTLDGMKASNYEINLIDSPGHIDFSSEVSSASKLSDGCLVLVDAVEGICTQTVTVLKQAWEEQIKPVLVLNKIDRLITELKMTPDEAFVHLKQILEQINAIMATMFSQDLLEQDAKRFEKLKLSTEELQDWQLEEKDDADIYFSPERGNVIFASAIDGWAFRIDNFVHVYTEKLKIKPRILQKCLWGEYYLDTKTKRVVTSLKGKSLKPMFVQFVLQNIWAVYSAVLNGDKEKVEKIVSTLGLKILPRDIKSKDTRALLQLMMNQWLPLASTVLLAVVEQIPSPKEAQKQNFVKIFNEIEEYNSITVSSELKKCISECDATIQSPAVAYVSKMISVMRESGTSMIGLARLYSGVLEKNTKLYIIPLRKTSDPLVEINVENLYKMMGRDFVQVDKVVAGQIFGIEGLGNNVIKCATLSSSAECPSLGPISTESSHIVRVAVEPLDPTQTSQLNAGLELLNRSDPCVEVIIQETGEQIVCTAGELHLERCLTDLREWTGIEISVSEPLVPFKETISNQKAILKAADSSLFNFSLFIPEEQPAECGRIVVESPNRHCTIEICCKLIPPDLLDLITSNEFSKNVKNSADSEFKDYLEKTISFGPKKIGPNMLLVAENIEIPSQFESSIITGFQLATAQGPLCAEPMHSVMFTITSFIVDDDPLKQGQLSGQLITTFRDACKLSFLDWSPRLMLSMYSCELNCPSEVLGKVYAVLSKRRGRILSEEMRQGTPFFIIKSLLPVAESFGFSDDIRKRSSGAAQPQLVFHGYELLDIDPFWVPTTEEELEDLGEKADRENLAKKYMDQVRERKGMATSKKRIEHAEKQKTLKIK